MPFDANGKYTPPGGWLSENRKKQKQEDEARTQQPNPDRLVERGDSPLSQLLTDYAYPDGTPAGPQYIQTNYATPDGTPAGPPFIQTNYSAPDGTPAGPPAPPQQPFQAPEWFNQSQANTDFTQPNRSSLSQMLDQLQTTAPTTTAPQPQPPSFFDRVGQGLVNTAKDAYNTISNDVSGLAQNALDYKHSLDQQFQNTLQSKAQEIKNDAQSVWDGAQKVGGILNRPFAFAAASMVPAAPIIENGQPVPGTDARAEWLQKYPLQSTGSETADKVLDSIGGMLGLFTPMGETNAPAMAQQAAHGLMEGTRVGQAAKNLYGDAAESAANFINNKFVPNNQIMDATNLVNQKLGPISADLARQAGENLATGTVAGMMFGAESPFITEGGDVSQLPQSIIDNGMMFGLGEAAAPFVGAGISKFASWGNQSLKQALFTGLSRAAEMQRGRVDVINPGESPSMNPRRNVMDAEVVNPDDMKFTLPSGADFETAVTSSVINKMDDQTRAQFNDFADESRAQGMSQEDATRVAMNELAKHPEGHQAIVDAVHEQIQSSQLGEQSKAPVDVEGVTGQTAEAFNPTHTGKPGSTRSGQDFMITPNGDGTVSFTNQDGTHQGSMGERSLNDNFDTKPTTPKKYANTDDLQSIRDAFETGKFKTLDDWKAQATPSQLEAYNTEPDFVHTLWNKFGNGTPDLPTPDQLSNMSRQELLSLKLQAFFSGDNKELTPEQIERNNQITDLVTSEINRRDGKTASDLQFPDIPEEQPQSQVPADAAVGDTVTLHGMNDQFTITSMNGKMITAKSSKGGELTVSKKAISGVVSGGEQAAAPEQPAETVDQMRSRLSGLVQQRNQIAGKPEHVQESNRLLHEIDALRKEIGNKLPTIREKVQEKERFEGNHPNWSDQVTSNIREFKPGDRVKTFHGVNPEEGHSVGTVSHIGWDGMVGIKYDSDAHPNLKNRMVNHGVHAVHYAEEGETSKVLDQKQLRDLKKQKEIETKGEKVSSSDDNSKPVTNHVSIQDGTVKVQARTKNLNHELLPRGFDAKSLTGMSYSFKLDDYIQAQKSGSGNVHYAAKKFTEKQFDYQGMLEKHEYAPMVDRIVDSQISAIEKAAEKLGVETPKAEDRKPKQPQPKAIYANENSLADEVGQWMKENYDKRFYEENPVVFREIAGMIEDYRSGKFDELAENGVLQQAGNNPFYAKPFEHFTGVKLPSESSEKELRSLLDASKKSPQSSETFAEQTIQVKDIPDIKVKVFHNAEDFNQEYRKYESEHAEGTGELEPKGFAHRKSNTVFLPPGYKDYVLHHEAGHLIYYHKKIKDVEQLTNDVRDKFFEWIEASNKVRPKAWSAYENMPNGPKKENIRKYLHDPSELFADAHAFYKTNKDAETLTPKTFAYFDSMYPSAADEPKQEADHPKAEERLSEQETHNNNDVQETKKEDATNGEQTDSLGAPSKETLGGTQAEDVPGTASEGAAGESSVRSPRADEGNAGGTDSEPGDELPGSVGSDSGNVAVPSGREDSSEPGNESSDLGSTGAGRELNTQGGNYVITEKDDLGLKGKKTSYKDNVRAIKLMKEIMAEGRQATAEEQAELVKYVGWGGIAEPFSPSWQVPQDWKAEYNELKELLTPDEWQLAADTILNAHYTSKEVIAAMYDGAAHLGFDGGRVLEPSMGVGHFLGLMPKELAKSSRITGIEIDNITGNIGKLLYPKSDIRVMGFEDAKLGNDMYDMAIGNVPFGKYGIVDMAYKNTGMLSAIHNYFFAKALDKVRPGGIVMFITSRYTMDARESGVRKYISNKADLIGAIRLPNTAFKKNAGTSVVTDILVLQKRAEGVPARDTSWIETRSMDFSGADYDVNSYFHDNPQMVLGTFDATGSMYRGGELTVNPKEGVNLQDAISQALKALPENIITPREKKATEEAQPREIVPAPGHIKENAFVVHNDSIYQKIEDQLVPVDVPGATVDRIKGMIGIRDAVREYLRLQLTEAPDSAINAARKHLNKVYDAFVKKFNPLNNPTNIKAFADDPDAYLLLSLEHYDKDTKTAKKAAIFSERTVQMYKPAESAGTSKEALVISLNERGRIDLGRMMALTGKSQGEIIQDLDGMIYNDPQGGWVTEDAYLSGNVKEKLVAAQNAAELDPAFQKNVDALMKVQPPDLQKEEIDVKLGSHWVDKDYITQFAANLLRERPSSFEVGYNNLIAEWHFKPKDNAKYIRNGTAATIQFGTNDYDAIDLIEMTLNMKTATVRRTIKHPDGSSTSYVDQKATVAAREKQNAIKEEFQKWIWSDEKRANELVRLYNDRFNTDRLRQYNGEHLTFPGMNPGITLKPHQKDAVWRAMQSGNTLFAHAVGAGKTFEMIASMMELKRTGVINKPMWVVPNHLVEQMGSDFMKLYPAANILVAGNKDFEKEKRKKLFAKIATGNYDAVIVPHSSFGKISMSKDTVEKFYQDQLDQLELAMEQEVKEGSRKETGLAKKLRAARKRLQEKMQKQLSKIEKDDNVSFEELGVDSLVVDEAHEFKNLFYTTKLSRVAGLGNQEGSGKAFDLFMKTRYLQQLNGGKGVIFATGTPVSNSLAEMYTFQRYLQYNELEKRGIVNFDSWVSQFGEIKNVLELSPEGKGLRMRSRLTEVVNLPELLHLFRSFADVKTADELLAKKLITRPDMKDGKRNMVVSPPSEALLNLVEELAARAEAVRSGKVKPDEDNMLAIVGEGRKAALDMRLVDPSAPDSPDSKVNVAAAHIAEIYKKTKKFKTASGKTIDNGTQIVFLDLSTPKGEKMDKDGNTVVDDSVDAADISVYNDLRKKLIKNGVAAKDIAFIHDYPKDAQKEELFRKVNSGEIRILLGSTAKMGAGMNVQKRLTDLHHLDVPWRPSDVEQREGRILRQGNENEEVGIHAYITEKSFDAYMWQIIANKAKVVDQTMSGDLTSRRVVDPSGMEMSANEIKAAATGDERIITLANLDRDVAELELKYQSRVDTLRQLRWDAEQTPRQIKGYQNELAAAQSDLASRKDMKGENFTLELGKKSFKEREEAGQALIDLNKKTVMDHEEMKTIGSFGGFPVIVQGYKYLSDKVARNEYYLKGKQAYYPFSVTDTAAGTARSLEAALGRIDGRVKELGDKITHEQSELEKIQEQLVTQEQEAAGLREKYNEKLSAKLALEAELNLDGKADEIGAEGSDEGDDSGDDEGTPPRKSGKSYAMPSAAAAKKPRNTVKTRIQGLADSIQETDRVLTPRAAEKVADLIAEHLGTAIQKDYVQPRAEGTYTPSQGVGEVRGRSFSEWRTVGHELGHAFSDKLARIGDKEELRAMADALYPGGTKNMDVATQMEEGFAEFFRQWVADPDLAAQNAPKTTKLFENFIESDKKLKNVFSRVRTLVDNDFMNDELGRAVAGSIVHDVTDDGEAYGGQMYSVPAWRKLEFNVLDSTVPARALDAKVGKDLNDISLEKLMVIGAESSSMAEAYFNSIPRDKNGAFVGEKSLKDIFQSGVNLIGEKIQWKALKLDGVEEKQYKRMNAKDIFSAVAIAERINERYERGFRKLPMTPESAAKILEIADQRFPGLRDIINDYAETLSNAILDISVNEGIITPEVRAIVKAGSSHYIPLITDSKKANLLTGKSKSGRSYKSTVSRFKGEVAPVLDVYQATMMKLNELAKSVQYKRVLDQLSEYARVQDKSIGLFVKKIPQPVEASTFDAAAAAEKLGKMMGLDMAEIQDMADLVQGQDMTLFTPKGIGSINPNDPIIMNRYKGNIEYLRVAPDLYRMLTSLSSVQMNGVMQFLAKLSKLPRFTGLATARFMTNAVAVDITTALTQSKNPLSMMTTGTLESIKTMLGAYGHKLGIDTKWTQEAEAILDAFKASGGAAGSAESMIRTAAATSFKDDVVQMNAPGWGYATLRTGKRIVVRLINTPHDALRFIEEGPRLAEWITDVKKGMKEIRPDLSSRELFKTFINEGTDKLPVELQSEMERILVNAAYQSGEVTLPLGRRGASPVVRTWTASVPFMRGSLNGATKAAKMMFGKKTALRTWLTSTVFIGGLSALMYAMMGQNEDDKKVLEDLPSTTRDKYWVFPNGAAPGTYIYVKKPYEYAIAVNYAERFADQMYFNNKVSRKWNSDLRDPLPSTSWMSPWLQALREIEKNTNSLGGPIIPRSDENKFPAAQYGPTTSVTAREAANLYAQLVGDENGISPRVIDYYIKQTTGQWGGGALAGADMAFKLAQTGELKYGKDISGVEYSPILGSLVYGKAEGSSRVVDKFYSDLQTTQNLYATLQKYAKEKDISKLSEYATPENIQKLKMLPAMESLSKNMSDLRNAYGEIEGKDVDPIKAARLNAVQDYLEKYLAGLPYGFEPAYNEKAEISPAQLENMRQAFMADAQKKLDNELKHPGGVTDAAELLLKLYQRKQK